MTEKQKAQARWEELQEEEWKHNYFLEFLLFLFIINWIFG